MNELPCYKCNKYNSCPFLPEIYIAKPNTWYDKGTEARLQFMIENDIGLFCGIKNGSVNEEICFLDEFEVKKE